MKNSKLLLTFIFLLSLIFSTISCDRGQATVYEKYQKMKNSSWDRFDIKQFDIPIEETSLSYDITVVVRCNDQFKSEKLPFYVILTTPTGEESIREISVPVRESGKLITEPKGTKPDSRLVLWNKLALAAKGSYKISVENMIPKIQTEGIEEVGIVITKSK